MQAQERLKGIGEWMKVNSEAIYATTASPFPAKPSWGRITAKGDTLYLHVYQWSGSIMLTGIQSKVTAVACLADPGRKITWTQEPCGLLGYDRLTIYLTGDAPDENVSVVKIQFEESLQAEARIIEDDFGSIQLPACLSIVHSTGGKPQAEVNITGVVHQWISTADWFSWEFFCEHPGAFEVAVTATTGYHGNWDFGHEIVVECDGQENHVIIEDTGIPTGHYQKRTHQVGTIHIDSTGLHSISIKALSLSCKNRQGFQMSLVNLKPSAH